MPTYLDALPLDVIRVHIFPGLDYMSRSSLMKTLEPYERREITEYRIQKDKLIQMEMKMNIMHILKALHEIRWIQNTERQVKLLNALDVIKKNMKITQHSMTVRKKLEEKLIHLMDTQSHSQRLTKSCPEFIANVIEKATDILKYIDTHPYLYHIDSNTEDMNWSAVNP